MVSDRFGHPRYLVRRKVMQLFGGAFQVFAPDGEQVLYSEMKRFRLREDIRLYTAEDMQHEVLTIKTQQIIDFAAAYDVVDATTGEKVGALKRRGFKSLVKDEWIVMDPLDREIGKIQEDRMALALVRRAFDFVPYLNILPNPIPQKYHARLGDLEACTYTQNFNPFVMKLAVDFTPDTGGVLDRRLGLAAAILLCAVEGKE